MTFQSEVTLEYAGILRCTYCRKVRHTGFKSELVMCSKDCMYIILNIQLCSEVFYGFMT